MLMMPRCGLFAATALSATGGLAFSGTRAAVSSLGTTFGSSPGGASLNPLERAIHAPPDPSVYVVPSNVRLMQVITVMRHGDRAPISESAGALAVDSATWSARLPSMREAAAWDQAFPVVGPSEAIDAGKEPFGSLTRLGAQQCRLLGASLRSRLLLYAPHLLPNASEQLLVRATNIRRTQQSAQNFLLGLLTDGESGEGDGSGNRGGGGGGGRMTSEGLTAERTPIVPIHVKRFENETLLPQPSECFALKQRMDELRAHEKQRGEISPPELAFLDQLGGMIGYDGGIRIDQASGPDPDPEPEPGRPSGGRPFPSPSPSPSLSLSPGARGPHLCKGAPRPATRGHHRRDAPAPLPHQCPRLG